MIGDAHVGVLLKLWRLGVTAMQESKHGSNHYLAFKKYLRNSGENPSKWIALSDCLKLPQAPHERI